MRVQLAEQTQEILGQSDLVIITERVDDVALLIGQMVKMGRYLSLRVIPEACLVAVTRAKRPRERALMASQWPSHPWLRLDAGHAHARRLLRPLLCVSPPPRRCSHPCCCGHRRDTKQQHLAPASRNGREPRRMAGVQGRPCMAEPLPGVGAGWGTGRA